MSRLKNPVFNKGERVVASDEAVQLGTLRLGTVGVVARGQRNADRVAVRIDGKRDVRCYHSSLWTRAAAMTEADREVLASADDATLANWWATLNQWGWPERIPNPEPRNNVGNQRRSRLMRHIQHRIGLTACREGVPENRLMRQ